jgi:hypothetical protein
VNDLVVTTKAGPVAVSNRWSAAQVIAFGKSSPNYVKIAELVRNMRALGKENFVECPLVHRFNGKMYIRECSVKKGTQFVSKIHRTEHLCVLSKGVLAVWTEAEGVKVLTAPYYGITPPGTLRVLMALEDLVWTTFHFTEKTNVEEIEAELTVDPEALLLEN